MNCPKCSEQMQTYSVGSKTGALCRNVGCWEIPALANAARDALATGGDAYGAQIVALTRDFEQVIDRHAVAIEAILRSTGAWKSTLDILKAVVAAQMCAAWNTSATYEKNSSLEIRANLLAELAGAYLTRIMNDSARQMLENSPRVKN